MLLLCSGQNIAIYMVNVFIPHLQVLLSFYNLLPHNQFLCRLISLHVSLFISLWNDIGSQKVATSIHWSIPLLQNSKQGSSQVRWSESKTAKQRNSGQSSGCPLIAQGTCRLWGHPTPCTLLPSTQNILLIYHYSSDSNPQNLDVLADSRIPILMTTTDDVFLFGPQKVSLTSVRKMPPSQKEVSLAWKTECVGFGLGIKMEWNLWSWRACDLKMNMYIVHVYITVIFRSFWLDYFHDYVETVMFASECGTAACVRREPVGGKAAAEGRRVNELKGTHTDTDLCKIQKYHQRWS